ncbi:hypothetical protein ABW19_dt0206570 [Dactylella cylindrospora]|nr:hypothetical protein ABW19_dt0206570 [Dactylella cylindrospora]
MRPAIRLFQSAATAVKSTPRLVAFHPTGITGIATHPAPRPTLLNLYNSILRDLKQFPKESAYRTATEALVTHRKKIVEEQIPAGWDAFCKELSSKGLDSPPKYDDEVEKLDIKAESILAYWGNWENTLEDDREYTELIKYRNDEVKARLKEEWQKKNKDKTLPDFDNAPDEPDLSSEQVQAIEQQIGCGLIEELITQAYEEYKLVGVMAEAKP